MLFGRNLSAAEAQHGGLVDRTLWPGGAEQMRAAAKDLAAQSPQVKHLYIVEKNATTSQLALLLLVFVNTIQSNISTVLQEL